MTTPMGEVSRWRSWFWRHERGLAVAYLGLTLLVPLAIALPAVRRPALGAVQAAARAWDERWTRRLAHGEALLAAGKPAEAATYLEELDRIFPARTSRHARDKERERLLLALGRSEEALGHRSKAMAVYTRLAAFDSLNYLNHYELARAAERLLGGWAEPVEARDAFAAALRLLPVHLPSVRGFIGYSMDRSEWHPVVDAYRRYLDAFWVQRFYLKMQGGTRDVIGVVDGLSHWVVLPVDDPAAWDGRLELVTRGFAASVDSLEVVPALRVGAMGADEPVARSPTPVGVTSMTSAEHGAWLATDSLSSLAWAVAVPPAGVSEVRLKLRFYKPVDRGLLDNVATAYRNLLDRDGLAQALERSVAFPSPAAADRVLAQLEWVREGRLLKPDERPF